MTQQTYTVMGIILIYLCNDHMHTTQIMYSKRHGYNQLHNFKYEMMRIECANDQSVLMLIVLEYTKQVVSTEPVPVPNVTALNLEPVD